MIAIATTTTVTLAVLRYSGHYYATVYIGARVPHLGVEEFNVTLESDITSEEDRIPLRTMARAAEAKARRKGIDPETILNLAELLQM